MKNSGTKVKIYDIIWAFIIAALALGFNFLTVFTRTSFRGDCISYLALSNGNFHAAEPPLFKYRILTPLIASLFANRSLGFTIVNLISFFLTGIMLYYFMRKVGVRNLYAFLGEIIFFWSWRGIYYTWNTVSVDPVTDFLTVLALIFILSENDFWIAFITSISALNRENAIIVPIIYFMYLRKCKKLEFKVSFKRALIILIPVLFIIVLIRFPGVMPPHILEDKLLKSGTFEPYMKAFKGIITSDYLKPSKVFDVIISSWGILWILAILSYKKSHCIFKAMIFYIAILFICLSFTRQRILTLSFVWVIPLTAYTLQDIGSKIKDKRLETIIITLFIIFYRYWSQLNWLTKKSAEKIINLTKEILYFSSKNIVCVCTGLISFMLIYYLLKESKSLKKNIIPIILTIAFFISIFYWQSIFEKGKIDKEKTFGLLVLKNIKSASDTFMYLGHPCKLPKKWLKAEQKWRLAEKSLDIGDTLTAKKLFEEAKKLVPDVVKRYNLLAVYYNSIKKPDSALIWLYKGISFMPNDTTALTNIGMILYKKRLLDSAMMYFRKILLIEPKNAGALNNIGVVFLNKGLCDSAICYFKDAIKYNPEKWAYVRNYIFGLKRCKKNKELIKAIDYAVKKFPKNPEKAELIKLKRSLLSKLQQTK